MARLHETNTHSIGILRQLREAHNRNRGEPVLVDDAMWREVQWMSPLAKQTMEYLGITVIRYSETAHADQHPVRGEAAAPGQGGEAGAPGAGLQHRLE